MNRNKHLIYLIINIFLIEHFICHKIVSNVKLILKVKVLIILLRYEKDAARRAESKA